MKNYPGKTSESMVIIRAMLHKTPMSRKKDAARKHYLAAESAYISDDEEEVNRNLDAVLHALA